MAQTPSKISKAKSRLLLDHPFFATLLLRTQVLIQDHSAGGRHIALAATDGDNIYFNPDFLETCSVEDTMSVLVHEVGHDSLLHSLRLGARQPDLANQAMDHAINLILEDQGFKPPKSAPGGWLADKQYKGMNWERIYDDMRRKQKDAPAPSQGPGGIPQNGSNGKPGAPQPGKDWLHGDVLPSPKKDPAAQAAAEQKAKQRIAAAATAARLAGKLTGDLARMVDEQLSAKVHWTEVLRAFMVKVVKARDNWGRRNRRFNAFYLPTRRSTAMGPICFAADTSGSMFGDDLEKICSEMAHCAVQTKPESIRVVWADAAIKGEQEFSPVEFAYDKLVPIGGGGTDMRVVVKHVEKYDPQVLILFTDGYSPWDKSPPAFPVIIICTTAHPLPNWAEVIRI